MPTEELQNNFTNNELRSISANSMGRGSEAGVLPVMTLGFAGNVSDGNLTFTYSNGTAHNSGYTVGFMQWDFGQKRNASELVEAYNRSSYVQQNPNKRIDESDIANTISALEQNGTRTYNESRDIRQDELGENINGFLKTSDGYRFVMELQEQQYNGIEPRMTRALNSVALQNMNRNDAQEVLAIIAKVSNQAGSALYINGVETGLGEVLREMENNQNYTKEEIVNRLKDRYSNVVDNGIDSTLKGAKSYNTLYNDNGVLGELFRERNETDAFNIPNFMEAPTDQLLDTMFRYKEQTDSFIYSVNNNQDYAIQVGNNIRDEAYSVGVRDNIIFTLGSDGNGYKFENNEWNSFNNNEENFVNVNEIIPRTLRQGSEGDNVANLQEKLNILIEEEKLSVELLEVNSHFDDQTTDAIIELQRINGLSTDGVVGKETLNEIHKQLNEIDRQTVNIEGRLLETEDEETVVIDWELEIANSLGMSVEQFNSYATNVSAEIAEETRKIEQVRQEQENSNMFVQR